MLAMSHRAPLPTVIAVVAVLAAVDACAPTASSAAGRTWLGTMTDGTRSAALHRLGAVLIASALVLAACGSAGTPRPTDPRKILIDAVGATAALPTLRLHGEIAANSGAIGGQANAMTIALDANVDLATRQFAARATTQMPQNLGVGVQQVSEVIMTTTASFNRDTRTGRWSKFPTGPGGGLGGGPTNPQIAAMIASLLSNPSTTLELGEAAPCTLGTCDRVVAHIDGQTLGAALSQLLGVSIDASSGLTIPNFDIEVLVDQSSSVISEMRTQMSLAGTSMRILLTISNPGQPIQIAPPPAAITDDFGANFGGGGIGPAPTPVESVGAGGLATPAPLEPQPSLP